MKIFNLIKRLWTDSHEKQSPQRFGRYAAMLIMLLTLGVGQMWGATWSFSGTSYMYFHNKAGWTDSGKMLFIGKDSYSSVYTMSAVSNTQLWVVQLPSSGWSDASYMAVAGGGSVWGSGSWGPSNRTNATHYTNTYTSGLSTSSTQYYVFIPNSTSNNASISLTYLGNAISNLNKTITVKAKVSTNGGSSYSEATSPGTLSASSKKFSSYNSCGTATSLSSGTISCGYTATTTLTAADATGYDFVGWYNSSGTQQTTSKTLTIYPTDNTTYYAYYKEKQYSLTFSHNGHGSIAVGGSTVASGSTANVNHISTKTLVATPNTGYDFSGWTKSGSNTGSVTIANASAASTTIKATNTGATITAGFTPKTSTVTLNNQDATTSGTTEVTATYDAEMPAITLPTKTGYTFGGYWGAPGGGGPQYYDADGSSTQNWNNVNATYTLFAKWTENLSTVTLTASPSGKGSFTIGGAAATSTTAGVTTTRSVTAVPIAGYSFDSWSISGGASISSTSTNPTTVTGGGAGTAATLTATFVANPVYYDVTFGVGTSYTSLGSLSATNNTTSSAISSGDDILSASNITFTATPNTGYVVEGWYTDAACTAGKHDEGSTTYTIASLSSAVTVYVKFVEKTWSVAFAAGTGGTVTTPASTPKTVGQVTGISIAATPATGYTFNSWSSSSGGSFTSGTSTNSNTFKPTANTTVTASFNETKSTITVTTATSSQGTLKFGSTSKSWGATASLGVATTQEITATAAAGFTFVRWDLSGAAASASTLTNATITLKADGTGSTGTATAVFAEDLSSTFYISGASSARSPFTGWGASGTPMFKKTGHSTEEIYYCTISVNNTAGDGEFEFKPYNSDGDVHYGHDNYWVTNENHENITCWGDNPYSLWFKPYVTGDYEFKIDNTGTYPVLSVTWPVFNQVRISAASPTDATNTGNFDMSDPVSNVRSVTRSLKANTTYTFKIMYNSDWYGYNSGTFTRSTSTSSNERTISTSGGNMTLTTDYAGDYTFKFNQSTKALSVDFPAAYKVTYGKGTVDGSSSNCSAVDIDNSRASVTSNSTWVLSGHKVELTAPAAKSGYTYNGWFDNNSGTGDAITTNANCTITVSSALTRYACYTINNHAITHSASSHGTYTIKVGSAAAVSTNTTSDYGKTITLAATPATGYHFGSWSAYKTGTPATTVTVTSNQFTMPDYAVTVGATFTPNTYRVHFHRNGGAGDVVEQNFTYDVAQNLTANTYTRTGYNFAGWALAADAAVTYADGAEVSNLTSENGATFHLYAKWTPKTTAITLDQTGAASSGSVTTRTGTYNANMPAITGSGSLPTAPQGYAFMGYYDALEPLGTKYYNADGTSAHTWDKEDAAFTLHAYFKQAEITGITFSPGTVVENNSTVTVTAVISPTPTGTTTVCWRVLYDNGSALDPQPFISSDQGTSVSFTAPNASGMYKVEAKLRTGSSCGAGTLLDTEVADFQVAGSHNVTVAYKQGSTTIKASTIVTGRPLDWSDPITAPEIFGYTFDHWTAGDGITLSADGSTPVGSDESSANPIYITAIYNGTLTANYTPKNIIYFKDNLEWTDPDDADAHIYVNLLTGDYWNADNGTGNEGVTNRNLEMSRVPGTTDIFYYDYGSKPTSKYISFTKESMDNYEHFYQSGTAHVVFPSRALDALDTNNKDGLGFYAATPMFVPLATQTPVKKNSNHATYYNDGYWTKYLPGTGYTLQIYNSAGNSLVKEVAFTSADELMPMKVVTDLEGNHTYKFQLKRDGDVYYGNNGTMTYADHGQNTAWDFFNNSPFNMCTIVTTAAGDYTFNLSYSPNSGGTNNRLRISVDYPVSSGDYRLVYKDDVHTKMHPSAIVNKVNDGTDIVSFFVRKDENPKLYIQQATVNPSTGAITWNEYPTSGTPTNQITGAIASAITKDTVYNFNLSMNGSGALTVASAEYYSGNYYIRTDAANSKWDNYRTDPDHLMTYSDYLKTDVGYSHYYTHWVRYTDTGRKNVKFVIANDYSPCISDTLAREEATGTWANIATFMEEGGDLKRSANVRFMWDIKTNAIARAYIDGAQEDGTHFLELLSADDKIKNTAETETLTAVTFSDNGNWIYEANIKAQPDAQIKLKSTWGEGTTIVQYFKGGADAEDTETLIGGSGENWYPIRVLYDFKTNRLVAAYVPTTGTYNTEDHINADVMFIREHQGDIAQLTFGGSGAISDIKTAYGVLRLNKWTINNKSKEAGHAPLSPEISRYERDLFYISFPFRVNLEEVFGFGTYGTHWIVEEYDGAGRAANGFWKDTPTFWRFITNRKGKFLEPNIGYIVALDLDELGETSSVWANTEQVELYFPSYGSMPDIKSSSVTHEVPAHTCTINRPTPQGDRRVKDSHWNVMSVPTYINTNNVSFANTDWITTATETSVGPKFLYTVNWNDNSLTATNGVGYTYKAMHAYIVQYCGNVTWTTSVSPALAPRRNPDAPKDAEFCIELQQNEVMIDRTFVRLTDDEAVTSGFEFNYDMSKEFNKNKANIYTMVTTIMEDGPSVTETAGNCLPLTDQTTIVPMGVQIATNGDYTFSIPSGTNGVGVTLVDNETGIRTNLALMDYTIALEAGTQDDRFYLEISPIKHVATDIENTDAGDHVSNVRKMMVDGLLYIIKDGKVFDAHGARVK